MIIMAMCMILLFIVMNIKNLIEVGFPDYVPLQGFGFIDSINHSQVLTPYICIFIILLLSKLLYILGSSYYVGRFLVNEITYGTITSITYSSNRVNNKPLVNIEVKYLELTAMFEDQPGDFGFKFKKGDTIPIKYQKDKPEIAIIPEDSIEILKQHPEHG